MCFIAAVSSTNASTGHIIHGGTRSFKTHSTYCSPDDFEQSRQLSYLAAVVGKSEASRGIGGNCVSAPGSCISRDISQENSGLATDKDNSRWNKQHPGSLKNQRQPVTGCKMSAAMTKLHIRSFSDLDQWLQNGEDDTTVNYIDRRVVESVLKCRQLRKQFPEQKSTSQLASHRLNCVTNVSKLGSQNNSCYEAGQLAPCRASIADNLYQEFDGKLETEVDGDSGFSGDRNSASSTSSGLSVESSLTSLGSASDFLSGIQSSSGSATSVLSVDQSVIQAASPVPNIPGLLETRTTSLSSVSASSMSEVVPDVQSSRLMSSQLCGSLSRHKTVEPSSQSCHPADMFHSQEPRQPATNSGLCSLWTLLIYFQ